MMSRGCSCNRTASLESLLWVRWSGAKRVDSHNRRHWRPFYPKDAPGPESKALDYVAGYCVVNDISERNFQLERGSQWDKGKGCDTFGPLGPWLVTADEIPDPQRLGLWLEVDGHRYQDGNTRTMVFGVAQIVSYLSRFMSLQPGDVISTGTPPGVGLGQKPPVFLKPGQTMRLGIDGLGVQTQRTVAA